MKKQKLLVGIGTLARMGGAERQAVYFVNYLAKIPCYEVEVLTFADGSAVRTELMSLDIPIHTVPYYTKWPAAKRLRSLLRIAWLLRTKVRPDALLPFGTQVSKALALVWPYTGAEFCWWNQQDEGRGIYRTETERRILHSVSCVNSNSNIGKHFLCTNFGVNPERITVYNNGTPIPETRPSKTSWKKKLACGDKSLVTMVANIKPFKDHATLIRAWAIVKARCSNESKAVLTLAGNISDPKHLASLKALAFDLHLSEADIRILGPVADVNGLLFDSDLVVHSSLTEGCPNAVCEAMAMGRAVIATDIPGCRQALGNDQDQWLVPPSDAESLGERILQLLENDLLRTEIGRRNRDRIAKAFSVEQMNEIFVGMIRKGTGA